MITVLFREMCHTQVREGPASYNTHLFPSLFHMAVKYATHLWKLQQQMENGQISRKSSCHCEHTSCLSTWTNKEVVLDDETSSLFAPLTPYRVHALPTLLPPPPPPTHTLHEHLTHPILYVCTVTDPCEGGKLHHSLTMWK